MALPVPEPGLVIRYAFLWRDEAIRGQEEGEKDRPCAVVVTTQLEGGQTAVLVLPVTHTPPSNPELAVEIPAGTKRRIGLDDQRSWIIVTDLNRFVWPGPDIRPREAGRMETVAYGYLPADVFRLLRDRLARALDARLARIVNRTR